jgi:peptidoglycan/xylan/chitin deacetylase (PgdA/CDA1 family)
MALVNNLRQLYLTFDTEDFISDISFQGLLVLLNQLHKHEIKALFFISGHMAERLFEFPKIVDLLEEHRIGYHSSSHSVHPTVFEFTDVASYEEAYEESLSRETSHVNPLTGAIEGKGGINSVRKCFPNNKVNAFRAPGFCWSPPHLEALRDLGIEYDFSTNISRSPFNHRGLTFYPYPTVGDWKGSSADYRLLLLSIQKNKHTVACLHPSLFVNQYEWDSIYWKNNPQLLIPPTPREPQQIKSLFKKFDWLLMGLRAFNSMQIIEIAPNLLKSNRVLTFNADMVDLYYEHSARWCKKFFNYYPRFINSQFHTFFGTRSLKTKKPCLV